MRFFLCGKFKPLILFRALENIMKSKILFALIVCVFCAFSALSQTIVPTPTPNRQRVIVVGASPTPEIKDETTPTKKVIITNTLPPPVSPTPKPVSTPIQNPIPVDRPVTSNPLPVVTGFKSLAFGDVRSKIAEAKRQMQTRPLTIVMTEGVVERATAANTMIRIAFYDWNAQKIDYVIMSKEAFLTKEGVYSTTTENNKIVTVRTIRPNGVNTPVTITDTLNRPHLPLMVQYPVEKGGRIVETAYYLSTHPGLVTPEIVNAGKLYLKNTIDIAREKLRQKGIFIQPKIADIAERLSALEHVDHYRFRTEYHPNIYNDVFALYALNEGNTYRYAVSSAGAGGMVQMIPSTYRMVRARYPQVNLMPDFVEGMRDHGNAAQAMLLYMQWTWSDLIGNQTVYDALESGLATEEQLMAAGYNSNPARLSGYIKRGSANWASLIPRETKIYLQILESMDRHVPIVPRAK